MTYVLYGTTQRLFRASVDQRLTALASVAALQFSPAELDQITGPESVPLDVYRSVVLRLQAIRRETHKVRYAYIFRPTVDPMVFAFVADADSLDPDKKVDLNGDGVINDEDALVHPGDPYDVSGFPQFRAAAFSQAFVDPQLSHDQWGTFLSGTAPIRPSGSNEPARYVLGLDLDVSDFEAQTNRALWPFIGFVAFLLLVITALSVSMAVMWRRQVGQLAEIDRQKDELIGIVSHQLVAPVAAVHWSLEEMLDGEFGPLTAQQTTQVKRLLHSLSDLTYMTRLLLDVSRIELGRLRMDRRSTDVSRLLADAVLQASEQAKQKRVELRTTLPKKSMWGVLDSRLVRIAVDNLLSNAIKYTPEGGKVELSASLANGRLRCKVTDTGIGIPPEDQPKIFGKLFRATNARDVDGHGFGLYVAKGAIEQQGGRLTFTSRVGVGTTFVIELPVS